MTPQNNLVTLPPEIKLAILKLLTFRDLCSLSRVCRVWRQATDEPQLWKRCRLRINTRDMQAVKNLPNIARYSQTSTLRFDGNIPAKEAENVLR